jgi:hypothetical protein
LINMAIHVPRLADGPGVTETAARRLAAPPPKGPQEKLSGVPLIHSGSSAKASSPLPIEESTAGGWPGTLFHPW